MSETTSPLSLYVSDSGSDSNSGIMTAPFLTVLAAINSLPKTIKHSVHIRLDLAEDYETAIVEGFTFESGGFLQIQGLLTPAAMSAPVISFLPAT